MIKFRDHVSYAVNKASRLLGLIRTTFSYIDEDTLPRLLTTLVRPHLEYGNIIWHPRYRIDKIQIEKMQRWTTKLIPHLRHLSHEERLQALKLPSLDFRRRRGDIIQVFKIMNGLDRLDPEIFFSLELKEDVPGGTRTSYSCVTVGLKFARTCSAKE